MEGGGSKAWDPGGGWCHSSPSLQDWESGAPGPNASVSRAGGQWVRAVLLGPHPVEGPTPLRRHLTPVCGVHRLKCSCVPGRSSQTHPEITVNPTSGHPGPMQGDTHSYHGGGGEHVRALKFCTVRHVGKQARGRWETHLALGAVLGTIYVHCTSLPSALTSTLRRCPPAGSQGLF